MRALPDDIDFAEYLRFIGTQESQSIKPLSHAADLGWQRLANGPDSHGDPLPWQKTHKNVRLRTSEVVLWAGVNGSGKSTVINQAMCALLQTSKVFIASLEMPIPTLQALTARQLCGRVPSETTYYQAMAATDGRLWAYDETDSIEYERVLGAAAYAAVELGCRHIVIDSLVKCGLAVDDYNSQRGFVDRLCQFAKRFDVGIHLVHHLRKGATEMAKPDKWDIKGAGEITDLVDTVALMWRNKPKEIAEGKEGEPDAMLLIRKQRHGEWEGDIQLWYDLASRQYFESPTGGAENMLRYFS